MLVNPNLWYWRCCSALQKLSHLSPSPSRKSTATLGHACPGGRIHHVSPPTLRVARASFTLEASSYHFLDGIVSSVIIFHRKLPELYLLFEPATVERDHFSLCFKPTGGWKGLINTANQEYFISIAARRKPTCNKIEEECKKMRRKKRKGRKI